MNLRASYGFGASVCANLLRMRTTMADKENDSVSGEMGSCVQSPADDLIEDRAVDLLAQLDEVLLKGTLKDATALMESIPEELVPVIRSNQRFLAYLREATQTGQFADRLFGCSQNSQFTIHHHRVLKTATCQTVSINWQFRAGLSVRS